MRISRIQCAVTIAVLAGINALLMYVCVNCQFPPWAICVSSAIGAAVGMYEGHRSHHLIVGGIAGSAGGVLVCFGLGMFTLGYFLHE
jgi:hypothetical protein